MKKYYIIAGGVDNVSKENEKWVSMEVICKHLGFGKDTIKKLVYEEGMPAYKPDNKIWKFKISEVDEWMKTKKIASDNNRR